jgi:hypothetical protein
MTCIGEGIAAVVEMALAEADRIDPVRSARFIKAFET